jgi:uncharacterized protein (TIGR02996 family)
LAIEAHSQGGERMNSAGREAFMAAVRAAPGDAAPRLALADWLDECGETDGELVRLLCEVQASGYEDGPAWRRLKGLTGGLAAEIGRLLERDRQLFLCDCAERKLPLLERAASTGERPGQVIEAARHETLRKAAGHELTAFGLTDRSLAWLLAKIAARPAEVRWQLCRAIEYRLGFRPPPVPAASTDCATDCPP